MNIVPTAHTRRIAQRMADDAAKGDDNSPADVVIEWLHRIDREQLPALVGLLLGYGLLPGHVRTPNTYTAEDRNEARNRYVAGDRDPWVVDGYREHERIRSQQTRDRKKLQRAGRAV